MDFPEPTARDASRSSRRRMLVGTAAAVGGVLAAEIATAPDALAASRLALDVTQAPFSAYGDGVHDDTAAIQRAIDTAATQKPSLGGQVMLPAGVYRVRTLRLRTNVTLTGAGINATILRSGGSGPLIAGGSVDAEIGTFSIRSLTLDGARSGGDGINVHGYAWSAFEIEVRNFRRHGIVSAHSASVDPKIGGMEARLSSIVVHDCLGGGIQWDGPHDSIITAATVYANGPNEGSTTTGIATSDPGGQGTVFIGCHVWGTQHRNAWHLGGNGTQLTGCEAEGATGAQIVLACLDAVIVGGKIFSGTTSPNPGIQLGTPTSPTAGTQLATRIVSCSPGLRFVNDLGLGDFDLVAWQPADTRLLDGEPHPTNGWQVRSYGPGEGDTYANRKVGANDLAHGWVGGSNETPAAYFRDGSHIVHLQGTLSGGEPTATALVLPVGFRPKHQQSFPAITFDADGTLVMGRVDIFPTGEVVPMTPAAMVGLDGVQFRADH